MFEGLSTLAMIADLCTDTAVHDLAVMLRCQRKNNGTTDVWGFF